MSIFNPQTEISEGAQDDTTYQSFATIQPHDMRKPAAFMMRENHWFSAGILPGKSFHIFFTLQIQATP